MGGKALVLDGEDPEAIVAEHHHQVDFSNIDMRYLATLWQAPIIVTTAVQFFETLGSHHPAQLRGTATSHPKRPRGRRRGDHRLGDVARLEARDALEARCAHRPRVRDGADPPPEGDGDRAEAHCPARAAEARP